MTTRWRLKCLSVACGIVYLCNNARTGVRPSRVIAAEMRQAMLRLAYSANGAQDATVSAGVTGSTRIRATTFFDELSPPERKDTGQIG